MMRVGNIGASVRYLTAVRANLKEAGQPDLSDPTAKLPSLPNVQSQLAMPLLVKDRLIGVLVVESPKPNAFDELDEILLTIVASQAATAIDNARMYQMVEQLSRLKRFFSPQLAELILVGGTEDPLKTHRREVTVVFLDLRGFTMFAEQVEPEEVMGVLRDYHAEMGRLILDHEGTLERFTGDGMMIFFNDPVSVPNPAERALRMALAMRERVQELSKKWRKRGYDLALGIGIAQGYATIGAIGFEGRWDYGAIGTVTNLAARLCGEAKGEQILVSLRVAGEVEDLIETEEVGPLTLKGFHKPVPAFNAERQAWLDRHPAEDRISTRILRVRRLETLGAEVLVVAGDVTSLARCRRLSRGARAVRHDPRGDSRRRARWTASALAAMAALDRAGCEAQLAPKVRGTAVLERGAGGRRSTSACSPRRCRRFSAGWRSARTPRRTSSSTALPSAADGRCALDQRQPRRLALQPSPWRQNALIELEMLPEEGVESLARVLGDRRRRARWCRPRISRRASIATCAHARGGSGARSAPPALGRATRGRRSATAVCGAGRRD